MICPKVGFSFLFFSFGGSEGGSGLGLFWFVLGFFFRESFQQANKGFFLLFQHFSLEHSWDTVECKFLITSFTWISWHNGNSSSTIPHCKTLSPDERQSGYEQNLKHLLGFVERGKKNKFLTGIFGLFFVH